LTNDDGFYSEGIGTLSRSLQDIAKITIVAPDRERSATSLSLTLHNPLRIQIIKPNIVAVSGTPADCIYLALQKILPRKPDLIISGINHGPNLGQQDISYSGTVAGAIQGAFLEVPSLAVSLMPNPEGIFDFGYTAELIRTLSETLLKRKIPSGLCLNVNVPPPPRKGIKLVKLGQKRYNPEIIVKKDPRKRDYYWIGTGQPKEIGDQDSDVRQFKKGYITVTPLQADKTDHQAMKSSFLDTIFSKVKNETV
jgi:5'-nucleotidase